MTDLDKIPSLWDEWQQLAIFFKDDDADNFEIIFENIEAERLLTCVNTLIHQSTSCSFIFATVDTRMPVQVNSIQQALSGITINYIVGAIGISLPSLPMLTLYLDAPYRLSLAYAPGEHWNPIGLVAFFLLIVDFTQWFPLADISIASATLTSEQMQVFNEILAYYVD